MRTNALILSREEILTCQLPQALCFLLPTSFCPSTIASRLLPSLLDYNTTQFDLHASPKTVSRVFIEWAMAYVPRASLAVERDSVRSRRLTSDTVPVVDVENTYIFILCALWPSEGVRLPWPCSVADSACSPINRRVRQSPSSVNWLRLGYGVPSNWCNDEQGPGRAKSCAAPTPPFRSTSSSQRRYYIRPPNTGTLVFVLSCLVALLMKKWKHACNFTAS